MGPGARSVDGRAGFPSEEVSEVHVRRDRIGLGCEAQVEAGDGPAPDGAEATAESRVEEVPRPVVDVVLPDATHVQERQRGKRDPLTEEREIEEGVAQLRI